MLIADNCCENLAMTNSVEPCTITKWNIYKLTKRILCDRKKAISFAKEKKLLLSQKRCPSCNGQMQWRKKLEDVGLGFVWQCKPKCGKQVSARKFTWFERSRMSIEKSLLIMYLFASHAPYHVAIQESCLEDEMTSPETISDYYSYCREVCAQIIPLRQVEKIGGSGMTVEIDLQKFGKRKHNAEGEADKIWVLGGICRETKDVFLIPVAKRDAETLIPLIVSKVVPGSRIMTDAWKAYESLCQHGFIHITVNQSESFVDPATGGHVNGIQSLWWQIKRKLPETSIRNKHIGQYLSEFMWRSSVERRGGNAFDALLRDISMLYPGKNLPKNKFSECST